MWRVALRSNEPGARGKKKAAIDPNDAVILLIDDQSGLFQVVKDIPLPQLRANLVALARAATLAKIPVEEARLKVGASRALLGGHQRGLFFCLISASHLARVGPVDAWYFQVQID